MRREWQGSLVFEGKATFLRLLQSSHADRQTHEQMLQSIAVYRQWTQGRKRRRRDEMRVWCRCPLAREICECPSLDERLFKLLATRDQTRDDIAVRFDAACPVSRDS